MNGGSQKRFFMCSDPQIPTSHFIRLEGKMPAICDVCGEEVSYSEPCFKLRNNAEIVICKKCIGKETRRKR